MSYAFMQRHAPVFSVSAMCRTLEVSRSGYYTWMRGTPSARAEDDQALLGHIRRVHADSREAYGTRRVWRSLVAEGIACGRHRIARIRRENGIETRRRRRFKVAITGRHHGWVAPDLVRRQFTASEPDRCWVSDVTFLRTTEGWLHLAITLDLYSRKVVGWAMSPRNDEDLVVSALRMAVTQRKPERGLIHHTDRGRVYSGKNFCRMLEISGIRPSMSRAGNCYDNACAESFFSSLKNELIYARPLLSRQATQTRVFEYIEAFYNRTRLHQTIGYMSPAAFEAAGYA